MPHGLLPYNDFFQHHSPVLWIILSPLFKLPAMVNYPVESFRLISTGIGDLLRAELPGASAGRDCLQYIMRLVLL